MSDAVFEGGCFCGAIRFKMNRRPMFIHACHCRDCQRQTGGPFAINGLVEGDAIEIARGTPVEHRLPTTSGRAHVLSACADCGAPLLSDYGGRGWLKFVRIMALDEAHQFEPDVHIYTRSKLPWLPLPAGARAFEAYYEMSEEWPAESLARRADAEARHKSRQ